MTANLQRASTPIADVWDDWLSRDDVQGAISLCSAVSIAAINKAAADESPLTSLDHWAAYAWLSGQRDASFHGRLHDDNERLGRAVFVLSLRSAALIPKAMRILGDLAKELGVQDNQSAMQSEQMVTEEVRRAILGIRQDLSIEPIAVNFAVHAALSSACRQQYAEPLRSFEQTARRNASRLAERQPINHRAARQA